MSMKTCDIYSVNGFSWASISTHDAFTTAVALKTARTNNLLVCKYFAYYSIVGFTMRLGMEGNRYEDSARRVNVTGEVT